MVPDSCTLVKKYFPWMGVTPEIRQLYKRLLFIGREYPGAGGLEEVRARVKQGILKHGSVTKPEEYSALIARGEYIYRELEALARLHKYRTLNKRYRSDEE